MSIKAVKTEELRRMNGKEGLVLQGCGGDPQEWLDGINGLLTDESILKNGSKFENISVFQNGSLTNILFPFEDGLEIDMGKLAMWRLRSHEQFGGTWLSDYVPNRLGGFITEHEPDKTKPDCKLIGEDGNIFNLMGLAARTLRHNGLAEQATEMTNRIHECGSYDETLCIIGEYVNITGGEESEDEEEGMGMRLWPMISGRKKPHNCIVPARYILRRIFSATKQAASRPPFAYAGSKARLGSN